MEADDIARRASKRQPHERSIFEERLFKPSATPPLSRATQPREELPQPPASGAPACGLTSGARLLLALEPQEGCGAKGFKVYLTQGTLPEKARTRSAWPDRLRHTASRTVSYTGSDQMMFPCDASLGNRGTSCWLTYMAETVGTTRRHEPSSARRSAAGSTGLRRSTTRLSW